MTLLDSDRDPRQLSAAKGCLLGLILSLPLWALLIAAAIVAAQIIKGLIA